MHLPIWMITLLARVKCYIHNHFQFPLPVFNLFFMAAPSRKTLEVVFWTIPLPVFKLQSFLHGSSFLDTWRCLLDGVFLTASSWLSTSLLEGYLKVSSDGVFLGDIWRCLLDGVFSRLFNYYSPFWETLEDFFLSTSFPKLLDGFFLAASSWRILRDFF